MMCLYWLGLEKKMLKFGYGHGNITKMKDLMYSYSYKSLEEINEAQQLK